MIKNRYVISKTHSSLKLNHEAIDIDTEYDFELAKILENMQKPLNMIKKLHKRKVKKIYQLLELVGYTSP